MPWKTPDLMTIREEFVLLANAPGANRRELFRRFGISPDTGHTWIKRYAELGRPGLQDRSRRPHQSPTRTDGVIEQAVVDMRRRHPAWGGRKISRRLHDLGLADIASSTVTAILHRHGLISAEASDRSSAWTRFEHAQPNDLWQIDFKGYIDIPPRRCMPLTVLDDHSRFNVALKACSNNTTATVQQHLKQVFGRYGLPQQINFDNGAPWGSPKAPGQLTELTCWLVQLGIHVSHSRPYHPQTNGKDERFHRTLAVEVFQRRRFDDFISVQTALDHWRRIYNHQRPHEALEMATPITRYRPSERLLPESLPEIVYAPGDVVIKVRWNGELRFRDRQYKVSSALQLRNVAIRPKADNDGLFEVYFAHHRCLTIDLRQTP